MSVRLYPGAVDEDDLHSAPIVGAPLHGVNRLSGMLGDPVLVGAIGPEDPVQVYGIVRHLHPRVGTFVRSPSLVAPAPRAGARHVGRTVTARS